MTIKILILALLCCLPLPACAFDEVEYYGSTPVAQAPAPVIIYDQGYGCYGYWYNDVFYPAPADFVYSETAIIYWGPFATVEPIVFYRVGFGYGYWCDGLWWSAPYGFVYRVGIHPYWGPCWVNGRYFYRGHYYGAYSSPGIHRNGYYIQHRGSYGYSGYRPPVAPHYSAPYRSLPPVQRMAPPQYHAPQNNYYRAPTPHYYAPAPAPHFNGGGFRGGFRGGHR